MASKIWAFKKKPRFRYERGLKTSKSIGSKVIRLTWSVMIQLGFVQSDPYLKMTFQRIPLRETRQKGHRIGVGPPPAEGGVAFEPIVRWVSCMMKTSPSSLSTLKLAVLLSSLALSAAAFSSAAGGCVEQPNAIPFPSGGSTTTTSGGTTGPSTKGEELFAGIQPDLLKVCGSCHEPGGTADTPFLKGPDYYHTVVSWPGIVRKDPKDSLFLTYSIKGGGHSGVNLNGDTVDPTLMSRVEAWLNEEAKAIAAPPMDQGPAIEPFVPILGFNAVYLGALGAEFEGMAVTFFADPLGNNSIQLREIEVQPTSKLGVHIVHPLFVVYPAKGGVEPDPIDSFSNVDQTFLPSEGGSLGPGTVVLTNWSNNAKLSVAFETIEKVDPNDPDAGADGGTPTGGCKDIAAFDANAKGQFQQRCGGCHAGGNGAATNAVDMSKLQSDSVAACAQILFRVKPADPPASQVFVVTDPGGNAAHPFKFGGNAANFDAFRTEIVKWIEKE